LFKKSINAKLQNATRYGQRIHKPQSCDPLDVTQFGGREEKRGELKCAPDTALLGHGGLFAARVGGGEDLLLGGAGEVVLALVVVQHVGHQPDFDVRFKAQGRSGRQLRSGRFIA
jgi:hypothetical protein